ncbi:MAG: hypothetical protein KDD47_25315, partial [Acidobacteria bacterium]|nr:hypothetical protein [Acidobacteriota bacterium]
LLWLAATLALVAVGLGVQVGRMGRVIEELSEPVWNPVYLEVQLIPGHRGGWRLEIPKGAHAVQLALVPEGMRQYPAYRIEIADLSGKLVLESGLMEPASSFTVVVPSRLLDSPTLIVQLLGVENGTSTLLDEQEVEVVRTP